jgi:DNA-binding NarL/FixJ family response regulator
LAATRPGWRQQQAQTRRSHLAAQITTLTPQPLRAMAMIGEALLNQQIAWQLSVSKATVKAHMATIMRKLGLSKRTQVALAASQLAVDPQAPPPDDD